MTMDAIPNNPLEGGHILHVFKYPFIICQKGLCLRLNFFQADDWFEFGTRLSSFILVAYVTGPIRGIFRSIHADANGNVRLNNNEGCGATRMNLGFDPAS